MIAIAMNQIRLNFFEKELQKQFIVHYSKIKCKGLIKKNGLFTKIKHIFCEQSLIYALVPLSIKSSSTSKMFNGSFFF